MILQLLSPLRIKHGSTMIQDEHEVEAEAAAEESAEDPGHEEVTEEQAESRDMESSQDAYEDVSPMDSNKPPEPQLMSERGPDQSASDHQTTDSAPVPTVPQYDPGVIDYGDFAAQVRRTVQQGSCIMKDSMNNK
jgi:hypothetical protein